MASDGVRDDFACSFDGDLLLHLQSLRGKPEIQTVLRIPMGPGLKKKP